MKKKLLITLGCSFTEGVGCYDPSLLDSKGKPMYDEGMVYKSSIDRFHTLGWPAQLQKKLQYDCLWNLGHGAASNSENVKRWFEIFSTEVISKEYDVLVIWFLTFADRISFYKNGKIRSVLPGSKNPKDVNSILYSSYINFLYSEENKNIDDDMLLEMHFCVKVIQTICELSNYNFLYINSGLAEGRYLDKLLKSTNSLNWAHKVLYPEYRTVLDTGNENYKAFCGHPNEKGYEVIADRIFTMIDNNHPELVNREYSPEEYIIKYLGEPRQW